MSDDFEALARAAFVVEAEQMLQQFESVALQLKVHAPQGQLASLADEAFRAVHTLKGSAGIFGMATLVQLTHQVESYLEGLRSGQWGPSSQAQQTLLAAHDLMKQLCADSSSQCDEAAQRLGTQIDLLCQDSGKQQADHAEHLAIWHLSWRPLELQTSSDALDQVWEQTKALGRFNWWPASAGLPAWQAGFEALLESTSSSDALQSCLQGWHQHGDLSLLPLNAEAPAYEALLNQRVRPPASPEGLLRVWGQMGLNIRERLQSLEWADKADGTAQFNPMLKPPTVTDAMRGPAREGPKIRVGASKLDELIERIAEVSTSVALVHEQALRNGSTSLIDAAAQVQATISQAREDALNLRMVPIAEVFARFPRLVHDLGLRLQREVELITSDGDAEIDRAIVESVVDPITHLIRNSIDHGIEPAEERLRHGKPAKGHIALSAYRDAGHVVMEVRDDGRGLDRDRIRARAVQRGLIQSGDGLTDDELLRLICFPGFSTADAVTDISGRGVGMDVVKRHVDDLHGELLISSEPGRGSCFQIRVPMTLALLNAFWVQAAQASYLIPLDSVVECINTPPECVAQTEAAVGTFSLREEVMPYVDLQRLFANSTPTQQGGKTKRQRRSLIVVRTRGLRFGLLVDRLRGEQQVVIKSLGSIFSGLRLISGAAILSNGAVAAVVDVGFLQELLQHEVAPASATVV